MKETRMRSCVIAAGLLLATAAPVLAQNTNPLRDGLDHLPATLLSGQTGDFAYFLDMHTLMSLVDDDSAPRPQLRAMPIVDVLALESVFETEPAEWEAKAGTTIDKIRYFTGYGRPPNSTSNWGLVDADAATDMIAALKAVGFEDAGVSGVVGNGEPQRFDPSKRDPSDPWRTAIGAAQFAAAVGTNVVQAQTPQAATVAAGQQPSLGDNPIVATALAGLEQAAGNGQVVQAVVISPLFGMAALDPAAMLAPSADMDETKERLEEQMAALSQGIPPYLGGIIADIQHDRPGVGIALTYPDCAIAEEAADAIATRWVDMAGDAAQGEVTANTAEGEGGFCAATVSVFVDADSPEQNPAYRVLIETYTRGQVGILQIGEN
ncbi:hypothetical protein ASG47_12275 [Devosia sp. Leaf420]|nr:hypothetical protein ASG47_12275 [Devosia sp. Leaf420]